MAWGYVKVGPGYVKVGPEVCDKSEGGARGM